MSEPTTDTNGMSTRELEARVYQAIISTSDLIQLKNATALAERYMRKPRRGGGTSLEHCAHVAACVARAGCPNEMVIAALLHDILEDAGDHVYLYDIRRDFGDNVADLVDVLTKKGSGKKEERRYLAALEAFGARPVLIKLYDNMHNLASCTHLKRPSEYVKYSRKIQALGARVLGEDDPLVLRHLLALRNAQMRVASLPISH